LPDEIAGFGGQAVDLISLESEFFYNDEFDNFYVQAFGLFEATAFGITDGEVMFAEGFDPNSPLATYFQITDVPFEDGSPNPDAATGFLSSSFSASFTLPDEKPDVSPVPLPASAWMLLAGLAGAGAIGRRAQQRKT
jgi:hypothetical protein